MASKKYQNKYRIGSIRKKNYDYSSNGAYFITIVTKNREHFFGKISRKNAINHVSMDDETKNVSTDDAINRILLSKTGKIAQKYWNEIPEHFPFIRLDEMVIMPNHIHGILWIGSGNSINRVSTTKINRVSTEKKGGITGEYNPMFHDNISRVIRWFKGRCTFEINKASKTLETQKFGWQSRFHDRIIRDENE